MVALKQMLFFPTYTEWSALGGSMAVQICGAPESILPAVLNTLHAEDVVEGLDTNNTGHGNAICFL